jgi:hypothetical protein
VRLGAERANDRVVEVESLRARKAYPARSTDTVVKYAEEDYLDWGTLNFFEGPFRIIEASRRFLNSRPIFIVGLLRRSTLTGSRHLADLPQMRIVVE